MRDRCCAIVKITISFLDSQFLFLDKGVNGFDQHPLRLSLKLTNSLCELAENFFAIKLTTIPLQILCTPLLLNLAWRKSSPKESFGPGEVENV